MCFINPRIGFDAVQVLAGAETVAELDYAIGVINRAYCIIRGQIEIMEVLRDGQLGMVEKDSENLMVEADRKG